MISGRGGGGGRGANKIRPPRRGGIGSNARADEFDCMWNQIKTALHEIHTQNASKLSFEQLYRASYKIVLKKQGDQLYARVKEFEEQWFATMVMPNIRKLITPNLVNVTMGGGSGVTANERRLTGEAFLTGLKAAWEDHNNNMNMTTDVLMYMDRAYCGDFKKPSIFTSSMGLFRDHILRGQLAASESTSSTFDILNSVILDQIEMERRGDVINRHLIRSCMYMLEGLYETEDEMEHEKLYLTVFEIEFLKASRKFYENEAANLLMEGDAGAWLRQIQERFAEEKRRCETTISGLTLEKITRVIEDKMIRYHLNEFLMLPQSGLTFMIENDRVEDIRLLYQVIARVDDTKEPLKEALQARVYRLGLDINKSILNTDFSAVVQNEEGEAVEGSEKTKAIKPNPAARATAAAIKWVDEVLQLKDKFDNLWNKCLDEDTFIQTAITKSFAEFINSFPRCSEYVSLFIDDNLKRGIKGKTEGEIDVVLEKATTLLRYLQDRDMFEVYYKKHLARRLLFGKSESKDTERQMISRMKLELGNSFTSKLEGMFKDMSLSEDLTSGYRTHITNLGDADRKRIDLSISILSSNCWPMESMGGFKNSGEDGDPAKCQFPPELKSLQDSFQKFYLKERSGRVLTWLGFLGNADLRCVFPAVPGKDGILGRERRHDITVPTYSILILLLFNDLAVGEYLSFDEIQQRTNIPPLDLSRQLHSIAVLPKCRVLTKDPPTKEPPKSGDRFCFNNSFTSKSVKIKAPVMISTSKVEGEEERKDTEDRNDEHRGNIIDSAIVRIMKARQQFTHQNLFAEVITQLSSRFKPDLNMMKRRVESLIEREYLERVENAATPSYRYLA